MIRRFIILGFIVQYFSAAFLIQPPKSTTRTPSSRTFTRVQSVSMDQKKQTLNLPPRGDTINELQQEFRDKISIFASFSQQQIASVPNPRLRALYEGVAASAHDPHVYRAFEVLFEDLMPLRLAGRLIFGRLASKMEEQTIKRQLFMEKYGLSGEEVDKCRYILDKITGSDHHYLSLSQVKAISQAMDETIGKHDALPSKRMSQEAVLQILTELTREPSAILQRVNPQTFHKRSDKKCKFEERYDFMVQSFSQWQHVVPQNGEGRLVDVMKGCLVGAKNEKVLEALKIVYVDYAPLRFAGDLIFQLVSTLVQKRSV